MNLEYFIAQRIQDKRVYKNSISARIIKIAIISISMALIMMLVAVTTGKGLQKEIREKIATFNGHITVIPFENSDTEVSIFPFQKTDSLFKILKNVKGIAHIQEVAHKAAILKTSEDFEGVLLKGVAPNYHFGKINEYLIAGRFPIITDSSTTNEIVVSKTVASKLNLVIGDKIPAYFRNPKNDYFPNRRNFVVVGIYKSAFSDFDDLLIFGDIKHIIKLNKWKENEIGALEIFIHNHNGVYAKTDEIYDIIPPHLDTVPFYEKYKAIFNWIALFDYNILVIIVIMILVGGINITTALLVLILERSKMIAILKTIGLPVFSVRKIFLFSAFHILLRGAFWGNAIGLLLLFSQKKWKWITLNPESYLVSEAPVYIDFYTIFALNMGVILICLGILWIPTYAAKKISPVKILRFQ